MSDHFTVVGGDAAGMSATAEAKGEAPEMDVVSVWDPVLTAAMVLQGELDHR